MIKDKMREDFEAWFNAGWPNELLIREGEGYTLVTAHVSWIAWLAAMRVIHPPMSDSEIIYLADNYNTGRAGGDVDFARAIESYHGIK